MTTSVKPAALEQSAGVLIGGGRVGDVADHRPGHHQATQCGRIASDGGACLLHRTHLAGQLRDGEVVAGGSTPAGLPGRHPDVGVPGRQSHTAGTGGSEGEGHPRLLHAPGDGVRVDGSEVPARVVRHRRPQQQIGQLDELLEPFGTLGGRRRLRAQHLLVVAARSGAQSADEPAARDVIERCQLLRERHRMPEGRAGHQSAQADARGGCRRRREGGHRTEPGLRRAACAT